MLPVTMRPRRYPLEALRTIRSRALDEAVAARDDARAQLEHAEAAHALKLGAATAALEARRKLLDCAAVSGAEWARLGAYGVRLHAEHKAAQAATKVAAAAVKDAQRALKLADLRLHHAYIEREVVERHHARFAEEERKRQKRAEDDEMDDLIPHLRPRSF